MGRINFKILILNWRDIKNPGAGGAEILTHEMAKLWTVWGHSVVQISAKFHGARDKETIDGVTVIRMGRWWSVHVLACLYYLKNLRGKTDVIIDEVHGIPFFAAVYESRKTILFVCEVADKLFFRIFPYPIALIGRFLEQIYFGLYRNVQALAISPSTKQDLIKHGFSQKSITVLPMGLTIPKGIKKFSKEKNPTIIYLSRINKQKGIEDAIESFRIIHESFPNARLWIVGSGMPEYVKKIKNKIKNCRLTEFVTFFGFVDEKRKFELLSRAHFLIFPSIHEGWGLVIAEAGIMGTPSAVYKVAGVKDVVKNGQRGVVAEKSQPELLAKGIIRLFKNDKLYKRLLEKMKSFEEEVGWKKTAKIALQVITKHENRKN